MIHLETWPKRLDQWIMVWFDSLRCFRYYDISTVQKKSLRISKMLCIMPSSYHFNFISIIMIMTCSVDNYYRVFFFFSFLFEMRSISKTKSRMKTLEQEIENLLPDNEKEHFGRTSTLQIITDLKYRTL